MTNNYKVKFICVIVFQPNQMLSRGKSLAVNPTGFCVYSSTCIQREGKCAGTIGVIFFHTQCSGYTFTSQAIHKVRHMWWRSQQLSYVYFCLWLHEIWEYIFELLKKELCQNYICVWRVVISNEFRSDACVIVYAWEFVPITLMMKQ